MIKMVFDMNFVESPDEEELGTLKKAEFLEMGK